MKRSKYLGDISFSRFPKKSLVTLSADMGRGVGTSGRAVAFCQKNLGLNPVMDLAILGSQLLKIYSRLALGSY